MASRSAKKARLAQERNPEAKPATKTLTAMDMHAAYMKGFEEGFEKGRKEGFMQASHHTVKSTYAAILIAAHKLFGFGQERGIRLLNEVHSTILDTLTTQELADRAFDEIGVEIDWTEPFEVAQPKDPVRKGKDE